MGGTTHSELVPPTLITIQENAAHMPAGQSDGSGSSAEVFSTPVTPVGPAGKM